MYIRPTLTRTVKSCFTSRYLFSTTARTMAEGDTGAPKAGGYASQDAFSNREKANEDYAIRTREKEKLLELRKRVAEQQEHLVRLKKHLDDLETERSGGNNKGT